MGAFESTNGVTTNRVPWGWLLNYGWATDGTADTNDPEHDGSWFGNGTLPAPTRPILCRGSGSSAVSNEPAARVVFDPVVPRPLVHARVFGRCVRARLDECARPGPCAGTNAVSGLTDEDGTPTIRFYRVNVSLP